jgi:hypothetical protein
MANQNTKNSLSSTFSSWSAQLDDNRRTGERQAILSTS